MPNTCAERGLMVLTQSMSPFTTRSIGSAESLFTLRSVWKVSIPKSHATEKPLLAPDVVPGVLLFTADQEDDGVSGCSDEVLEDFGAPTAEAAEG